MSQLGLAHITRTVKLYYPSLGEIHKLAVNKTIQNANGTRLRSRNDIDQQ